MAPSRNNKKSAVKKSSAKKTSTAKPGTRRAKVASEDAIRRRAYELYLARNGEHGHDLDDWLQAEKELATS